MARYPIVIKYQSIISSSNITRWITPAHWVVSTIGKHVIAEQALAGGGEGVGVEEATGFGVIVAGLEVVEAGLNVEDVAAVAQGIMLRVAGFSPFRLFEPPPLQGRLFRAAGGQQVRSSQLWSVPSI